MNPWINKFHTNLKWTHEVYKFMMSYDLNIMYFGFNGSLEQTTSNFHDANQFEW
jgi:hypothetical protein